MKNTLLKKDIQADLIHYLHAKSIAVGFAEMDGILTFQDSEFYNPEMADFLESQDDLNVSPNELISSLHLVFDDRVQFTASALSLRAKFAALKEKIRGIFCKVVSAMEDIDTGSIIKAVLIALVPAFAGGLPALVLPVVIGFVAALIKYGLNSVCPV